MRAALPHRIWNPGAFRREQLTEQFAKEDVVVGEENAQLSVTR